MFSRSLLTSYRSPSISHLRPFSCSTLALLQPGRSHPSASSTPPPPSAPSPPPPSNRTAFARITPLRVPASQALPSTPPPEQIVVEEIYEDPYDALPKRNLLKPFLFSTIFIAFIYIAAAERTNEESQLWADKLGWNALWRRTTPSQGEMMAAQQFELKKDLQHQLDSVNATLTATLPASLAQPLLQGYLAVAEFWLNSSEPTKLACMIVGVNTVVLGAWKLGRWNGRMAKWWMHNPASGRQVTLLTSVFSHQELWHFGFNMVALWSFLPMGYAFLILGDRQALSTYPGLTESTAIYHLGAFYLTAGILSSLLSHTIFNIFQLPRLLRAITSPTNPILTPSALSSLARKHNAVPSLGASGAIYAVFFLGAMSYPDAQVGIIFLPFLTMPIKFAAGAMMLLDVVGIWRAWKGFNHVAHLGGALFGIGYWRYGCEMWDWLRMKLARKPTPPPSTTGPRLLGL
ncbi:hypothetical protein BDY24DRAFT_390402 [Mrakia frigida]|uniref:rhomboid protease PCP1 n=1 Tax=Mrakia frigida TaxID=29902 RepID=UPI003FCBF9AE